MKESLTMRRIRSSCVSAHNFHVSNIFLSSFRLRNIQYFRYESIFNVNYYCIQFCFYPFFSLSFGSFLWILKMRLKYSETWVRGKRALSAFALSMRSIHITHTHTHFSSVDSGYMRMRMPLTSFSSFSAFKNRRRRRQQEQ